MKTNYARRRFKAAAIKRGHDAIDRAYSYKTRELLHPHGYDVAKCPTYYDGCNCGFIGYFKDFVNGEWTEAGPDSREVPDTHLIPARAGRPWWFWKWSR